MCAKQWNLYRFLWPTATAIFHHTSYSRYSQLNFAKHNRTRTQEPMETS
jgi:hypothetical protein